MATVNKGRLMGAKFKTFSGAAKRADTERFFERGKGYRFEVVEETDSYVRAQGFSWRIRKTKVETVR